MSYYVALLLIAPLSLCRLQYFGAGAVCLPSTVNIYRGVASTSLRPAGGADCFRTECGGTAASPTVQASGRFERVLLLVAGCLVLKC